MVRGVATAAAAAAMLSTFTAVSATPSGKTVAMNFQRREDHDPNHAARLAKRQKTVSESLSWGGLLYYINFTLGTPPQPMAAWIDTGSSDLWVPDVSSNICHSRQSRCGSNGGFRPDDSSTYKTVLQGEFQIQYASGDDIRGDYGRDVIGMDNVQLKDMTFGLANQAQTSTLLSGILGIGYTLGESAASQGATYPNLIDLMMMNGDIESKTYSLYLNDLASGHGTILFGGVDHDKYTGTLGVVNVQRTDETEAYDTFTVVLAKLTFSANGRSSEIDLGGDLPVILDSGTTLTYLPDDLAQSIYDGLGITYDDLNGPYLPCNTDTSNMKFTFTFGSDGGVPIDVDLGQFVLPYDRLSALPPINGGQSCQFGLFPTGTVAHGGGDILFGDTFLRSAYVVYNLDNNQIAMAQTKFDQSSSDVKGIDSNSKSTNTIPDATTVSPQVTAQLDGDPTGGSFGTPTALNGGQNSRATSHSATFAGLPDGGLATGSTQPAQPGGAAASSSNAAPLARIPAFDWASAAVPALAATFAVLGGSLFWML